MHDAVLLQLSNDSHFQRNVEGATEMIVAAFKRHLPRIKARVTVGSFAE